MKAAETESEEASGAGDKEDTASDSDASDASSGSDAANTAASYMYDIKVMLNGAEIEPDTSYGDVKVSFAFENAPKGAGIRSDIYHVSKDADSVLTAEKLDTTKKTATATELETADDEDANAAEAEASTASATDLFSSAGAASASEDLLTVVSAETSSFSYYVVEFTYGDLQYVLEGDTSVYLSEIFAVLELSLDTADITSVEVSDETLIGITKETNQESGKDDYLITALQAFLTEEKLTVTAGTETYTIKLTDAQSETAGAFTISATNSGDTLTRGTSSAKGDGDFWYDSGVLYINSTTPMTIKNTNADTTSDRIFINSGVDANITLAGVDISTSAGPALQIADGSTGNVNITLAQDTTNTLIATGDDSAGLQKIGDVTSGKLTITGSGELYAESGSNAAGIGGGNGAGSNITISGGTVTAKGGSNAAGIGGGKSGSGSNITISGGTVTATGGSYTVGIGGGYNGTSSGITVSGGSVLAAGGDGAAAIGYQQDDKTTDASGNNVYLFTLKNPKNSNVYFGDSTTVTLYNSVIKADDTNPTQFNHGLAPAASGGSADTNLYAYRPYRAADAATDDLGIGTQENPMVVKLGAKETKWYYDELASTPAWVEILPDLIVTGGVEDTDYTYIDGVVTVLTSNAITIKNKDASTPTTDRICVNAGVDADITLAGVNISTGNGPALMIADGSTGNVNITLAQDTTNTLIATGDDNAGLQKIGDVTSGKLTITGSGKLDATGGSQGAGIGGGLNYSGSNITISGGIVNAKGGVGGAGIGGGKSGSGSNITISGGTVNATGRAGGNGIGGGKSGSGSNITISGGTVLAAGGNGAAALGCQPKDKTTADQGNNVYLFTLENPDNLDVSFGSFGAVTKYNSVIKADDANPTQFNHGLAPAASGGSADTNLYAYRPYKAANADTGDPGIGTKDNPMVVRLGTTETLWYYDADASTPAWTEIIRDLIVTGGEEKKDFTYTDGILTVLTSTAITIKNRNADTPTTDRIFVNAGVNADITLAGVNINTSAGPALQIEYESTGNVKITLEDGTTNSLVTTSTQSAGLQKSGDETSGTLTIQGRNADGSGTGTLIVKGGAFGAGIGGAYKRCGSNIAIIGGHVEATGGINGAGIGGGYNSLGKNITISGGVVNATGGDDGAGIGGGHYSSGKNITISGGVVNATGGIGGAGIGGGTANSSASSITITGGTVTASGGSWGSGIGHGAYAYGGLSTICITGGSVKASSVDSTALDGPDTSTGSNHVYLFTLVNTADADVYFDDSTTAYTPSNHIALDAADHNLYAYRPYRAADAAAGDPGIGTTSSLMKVTAGTAYSYWYYDTTASKWVQAANGASTVSYNANGHGTAPGTVYVANGTYAVKPADPTAAGLRFGGWYKESACTNAYDFSTETVSTDIILYAKWLQDVSVPTAETGLTYIGSAVTGVKGGTGYTLSTTAAGVTIDRTTGDATAVNAGTYTVSAAPAAGYGWPDGTTDTKTITFIIGPAATGYTVASIDAQTYTGSEITPDVTVTFTLPDGTTATLVNGTDYDVTYSNNINAADAASTSAPTATIDFKGNYSGTATKTFTISPCDASTAYVAPITDQTYTGSAIEPPLTIISSGYHLVKGTDYEVTYSNNTNAADKSTSVNPPTAAITYKGNYSGNYTVLFNILQKSGSNATVTGISSEYSYTGSAITPEPVVVVDGLTLTKDTDYTLSYTNNVVLGSACITISFKNNYTGEINRTFNIVAATITSDMIAAIPDQTYTGSAIEPSLSVTFGSRTLVAGTDYMVTYSNNVNAGTGTAEATVTGSGSFTGAATVTFTIAKAGITPTVAITGWTYGQTASAPVVSDVPTDDDGAVTYSYSGTTTAGTTYGPTEVVPTAAGTYTVVAAVAESDNYLSGSSAPAAFTIAAAKYDMSGITFDGATETYDGQPHSLAISGTLPDGVNVTYTGNGQTDVGIYDVTAAFTSDEITAGNYEAIGDMTAKLTITAHDASSATVAAIPDQTYTGSAITPSLTITDGNGNSLRSGRDYTVAYTGNTNVGAATATIRFQGNYSGSKTVNFNIVKADITPTVTLTGWTYGQTANTPAVSGVPTDDDGAVTYTYYVQGSSTALTGVPTDAGSYTVVADIAATANYKAGMASVDFTIAKVDITPTVSITGWTYGQTAGAPAVSDVPTDDDGTVTYSYSGTTTAGTTYGPTEVVPTAAGAYTVVADVAETTNYKSGSSAPAAFTIAAAKYDMSGIIFEGATETYDGQPHSLAISGTLPGGVTVSYTGNSRTDVGNYTVTAGFTSDEITAGNYNAISDMTATLTVTACDAGTATAAAIPDQTYTGSAITPGLTVTFGNKTLAAGTDYTVTYTGNTDVGQATATVSFTGNYSGSLTKTFSIIPKVITVTTPDATKVYDGTPLTKADGAVVNGLAAGEALVVSCTGSQTDVGSSDNTYVIDWGAQGTTAKEANYTLNTAGDTIGKLTVTRPVIVDETSSKVEVKSLTQVPAALADNYSTVAELAGDMLVKLQTADMGLTSENSALYDATLMFSTDGGKTWIEATADNFPSQGIDAVLGYPAGTDRRYTFYVNHIFEHDMNGHRAGEMETPRTANIASGIKVHLDGLSPILVAWTEPAAPAPVISSGGSGESDSSVGTALRIIRASGDTGISISGINGNWNFVPGIMVGNGLRVIDGTAYLPAGSSAAAVPGTTGRTPEGTPVDGAWQYLINEVPYNKGWLEVINPYANESLGQKRKAWFYFGSDGLMRTGWFTNEWGYTFYLNRSSDGSLGEMATGWRTIDGYSYFFEDGTGSTDPNLLGTLYKNTVTPDGRRVDADGRRTD